MELNYNIFEENAILYYADFLSLKHRYHPITDSCKYFYVYGVPVHISKIIGYSLEIDKNDPYYIQAKLEYDIIKLKFGEDGVISFIDDICNIKAVGTVDALLMLNYIYYYEDKKTRKYAIKQYQKWEKEQTYSITIKNEDGNDEQLSCTKYVYHHSEMIKQKHEKTKTSSNL